MPGGGHESQGCPMEVVQGESVRTSQRIPLLGQVDRRTRAGPDSLLQEVEGAPGERFQGIYE